MRFAIYLTPPRGSVLARAAESWLGRSAFEGEPASAPLAPAAARAEVPARYGFHATLKAPFALRAGLVAADVAAAFAAFPQAPVDVTLTVGRLGEFFALLAADEAPLSRLADRAVRHFEPLRVPLGAADRARRRVDLLDAREKELLEEWGYPYVFERFRFHMTLTGPVGPADAAAVAEAAEAHFSALTGMPQRLLVAVFVEDEPGWPFHVRTLPEGLA